MPILSVVVLARPEGVGRTHNKAQPESAQVDSQRPMATIDRTSLGVGRAGTTRLRMDLAGHAAGTDADDRPTQRPDPAIDAALRCAR
jgi:hypothetical protein